jgi:hypothetical protein
MPRSGLAVRAERCRVLGRGGGKAEHQVGFARAVGVVGQSGGVDRDVGPPQRPQHPAVQRGDPVGRDALLHREPCELVAETDLAAPSLEQARSHAFVQRARPVLADALEQPQLGADGDYCGRLQQ